MKAVILAAGRGTRLRPLTYTKPKVLLPLANKPIIQHIVEDLLALKQYGTTIDEIFIVTNYLEGKIKDFFAGWPLEDVKITFVRQQRLGGTADALRTVSGMIHEDFILVNGDEVFGSNAFSIVLNTFRVESALAVVGAFESKTPERYGVLLTDSTGVLEDIIEKSPNPPTNLVNTGVYVFTPKIFEYIERIGKSERGEYELTDAIILMANETSGVFVSEITEWEGMSTLWNLFEANKMKIKKRLKKVGKDYTILMGQNVELKPGVHIEDNVVIGDNSIIGPNCYIRGDTSIGSNCRIGNGVEIKNSIIMDNSNVPHLSYIGDSIIGEHCNMGAGTISGNLRHDKMNVKILVKGEVVESDRYKLGFIAADWTKTGVGTMIYPGMILGPFSWTAPNETVNVNIEPFTLLGIKGKQKIPKEKIETAVKDEQDKRFLRRVYEELEDMKY
jgi:bifunctional UDP-N-acetylglucosamine pyrophosphorylase/glucosamine-1-phosphate N-acetyltransferase